MLTRQLALCLVGFIEAPLDTDVFRLGTTMLAHEGADQRADTPRRVWSCSFNGRNRDLTKGAAVVETNAG